jgi:hypothetical protein
MPGDAAGAVVFMTNLPTTSKIKDCAALLPKE